ncbi:venom allergen-like protein vap-2 [Aphelenchoides avenae]|nr:venom allergen-like protein vap-2 [Aphelenchus avenae]
MWRFLFVVAFAAAGNDSFFRYCSGKSCNELHPESKAEGPSGLTDEDRNVVQKAHNDYRTTLANGEAVNQDGTHLPQGADINFLQYDRDVEALAQTWASGCVRGHPPHDQLNGTGQNIWMTAAPINASAALTAAAESWWSELQKVGVNANLTLVGDDANGMGRNRKARMWRSVVRDAG